MPHIPNDLLNQINQLLNNSGSSYPQQSAAGRAPVVVDGTQISFQRMGSSFWKEHYKARFPKRGDQGTFKRVYDEIQREIDHARNIHQMIYEEFTRNRPDYALHGRIMGPVEERREGLIEAFHEVLVGSSTGKVRLSIDGLLRAFHIDTNWILPRLWHSVTEPLVMVIFYIPFIIGIGWIISLISESIFRGSHEILGPVERFGDWMKAALGAWWYVKLGFLVEIPHYVAKVISAFLKYELPSR